jgi:hypothetical protein
MNVILHCSVLDTFMKWGRERENAYRILNLKILEDEQLEFLKLGRSKIIMCFTPCVKVNVFFRINRQMHSSKDV